MGCASQVQYRHRLHLGSRKEGGTPGKSPLQDEAGPSPCLVAGITSAFIAPWKSPQATDPSQKVPQLSQQL